jgi:hypothetical protein
MPVTRNVTNGNGTEWKKIGLKQGKVTFRIEFFLLNKGNSNLLKDGMSIPFN